MAAGGSNRYPCYRHCYGRRGLVGSVGRRPTPPREPGFASLLRPVPVPWMPEAQGGPMTHHQLLLAIDETEAGQAAVDFTIGFAVRSHGQVTVLHVREFSSAMRVPPLESMDHARSLVEESVARLNQAGVPA